MLSSPEALAVRDFLRRARRRAIMLRAIRAGAAAASIAAIAYAAFGQHVSTGAVAAIVAAMVGAAAIAVLWSAPGAMDVAAMVERQTPASRNLILTAAELIDARTTAPPAIATRVFEDTRRVLSSVVLSRALPASRTAGVVIAALTIAGAAVAAKHATAELGRHSPNPDAATLGSIAVEITPPEYSRRARASIRDPDRVEAFAGSRIHLVATAEAATVRVETLSGTIALEPDGSGRFSADLLAEADGYIALIPTTQSGRDGPRRLIGLSVIADRAPKVRVTAPGHDVLVPDGQRTLPIAIEADDDLGLATLVLRYTRVSGSGENFSFKEGEVPLAIAQASDLAWTARSQWNLTALRLEPGDMLIIGALRRIGDPVPPAESDAFIVEIAAPGSASADGFAIDDREDRYALSQQMLIVKTERLLGRRASMPAADVLTETLDLAAEQRQVRAEFVFMMGGELADAGVDLSSLNEEVEAAGEEDLAAGRLANQGRLDILRAIRSMSHSAAKLADGDASAALPIEKEALAFLQRAFSKSRYILRTLGARERLDLSRRLTGVLAALGRDGRPAAEAPPNPRANALRRILSDLAGRPASALESAEGAAQISLLAQRTLQVDATSSSIRDAASKVATLANAISAGRGAGAIRDLRDDAASALATLVRSELPAGSGPATPAGLADLAGALADSLRNGAHRR